MFIDSLNTLLGFTPCGLILDASGVVLLGFSFFLKNAKSMIEESGTTWDSTAYRAVAFGKTDGISGTALLFLGFLYQFLGYVGISSTLIVAASYAALAVFMVLYVVWLRAYISMIWIQRIEAKLNEGGQVHQTGGAA